MKDRTNERKKRTILGAAALAAVLAVAAGVGGVTVFGENGKNGGDAAPQVNVGRSPGMTEESWRAAGLAEEMEKNTAVEQQSAGAPPVTPAGATFDANRFSLPEGAGLLVVVEGTGGSNCRVYAFEKTGDGWTLRVDTPGFLGRNGMSNHRTVGDKTTPIGLFRMNTPFGQSAPLDGFPSNYIQVDSTYVWEDGSNRLVQGSMLSGERVGTQGYAGHYDYVLDAGFNRNAIPDQGSALFLHCSVEGIPSTSGCVAIPKDQMAVIMGLYGACGDGNGYIAQAPAGTFEQIYDSYGVNNGLSPEGDFG